jgi:RNA polymerase sigma-70 factor (ECF subfamily)
MGNDINEYFIEISHGNMDALGKIYDLLSVRVFNYALTIAKSKETAEDITHDVFMQIIKHSSRLANMQNPTSYIMVATRNISYDYFKHKSRKTVSLDDVHDVATYPSETQMLLEDALLSLPETQRETIYLHYICGYTQKEVSRITGAALPTVKWRSRKALSQLQAYFKQD